MRSCKARSVLSIGPWQDVVCRRRMAADVFVPHNWCRCQLRHRSPTSGTAAVVSADASAEGTQLSAAVLMLGAFDWGLLPAEDGSRTWSRCMDMVWRARQAANSDRIHLVPTVHWRPAASSSGIDSFCYMQGGAGTNTCQDITAGGIAAFREGMSACIKEAFRQGMHVAISPHLDDGTLKGAWRNGLVFSPTDKYKGYSYYDVVLAPIADAVKDALSITPEGTGARVWFAMQGEMSATVMRHAADWAGIVDGLRGRATPPGVKKSSVSMGVGLNFNRLDDTTSASQSFTSSRGSWLAWVLGADALLGGGNAPPIDSAAIQNLFTNKLQFVGISAYAPFTGPGFKMSELENCAFMFADSMKPLGVDLAKLLDSGLELHYSEYGIGGGMGYDGGQPATSPSMIALRPFYGIYGPYDPSKDPWQLSGNRAFLHEYYTKTTQWLKDPYNKTYKVSAVFIWGMNSWDVLGIYPESTTPAGTYRDDTVVKMVQQHNGGILAKASQAPASVLGPPPPKSSAGSAAGGELKVFAG